MKDGKHFSDRLLELLFPGRISAWILELPPSQRALLGLALSFSGLILVFFAELFIPR